MRYDTKNFSIPTDSCFEEKHEWGVARPTVIVLVKEGNSFLYLNQGKQAELPQTELALGETITEATERVLSALGYAHTEGQNSFVGYFSVGSKRLPHFLVIHFAKKGSKSKRGTIWTNPAMEIVNHCLFETMAQNLLYVLAEMRPHDCLGWGEDGLIIWPCEERVASTQRTRRTAAEHMAA